MSSSPPTSPNFSRPLPSPYNSMGTPTRQPRATSADQVASKHSVPPSTSSARQVSAENWPLSASLSQSSNINTAERPLLLRKMSSIQDLASRFPVPPAPASAGGRIIDRKIARKVSVNDFLKEQWQPESSTPSFSPEHPPITKSKSKIGLSRQASFPSHERRASKDSKASDKSDRTVVQKLLSRKCSNSSLPTTASTKGKLHEASRDSTGSDQTVAKYPAIPQPNNGRPILNFRPSLWKHLDTSRDKLSINLLWPKKLEDLQDEDYDEEANMFPYDSMRPILQFRNLKSLTIGGMERSYQRLIWQTVFQNPQLHDLTLEMALEPVIITAALRNCMPITKDWIFPMPIRGWTSVTYLGHHGEGVLHDEFGAGEYLDQQAMKLAHEDVFGAHAQELHVLGISKLVLMGFVIDASPFFRWFSAQKLRTIVLKDNCFDVGFALPRAMRDKTQVLLGGELVQRQGVRAFKPGEAKIVTLSKGKVVDEEAVEVVRKPAQGAQLKKKFSGLLRKWQTKEKGGDTT